MKAVISLERARWYHKVARTKTNTQRNLRRGKWQGDECGESIRNSWVSHKIEQWKNWHASPDRTLVLMSSERAPERGAVPSHRFRLPLDNFFLGLLPCLIVRQFFDGLSVLISTLRYVLFTKVTFTIDACPPLIDSILLHFFGAILGEPRDPIGFSTWLVFKFFQFNFLSTFKLMTSGFGTNFKLKYKRLF